MVSKALERSRNTPIVESRLSNDKVIDYIRNWLPGNIDFHPLLWLIIHYLKYINADMCSTIFKWWNKTLITEHIWLFKCAAWTYVKRMTWRHTCVSLQINNFIGSKWTYTLKIEATDVTWTTQPIQIFAFKLMPSNGKVGNQILYPFSFNPTSSS